MLKITQTLSFSALAIGAFALPTAFASQVDGQGLSQNSIATLSTAATGEDCKYTENGPSGNIVTTRDGVCRLFVNQCTRKNGDTALSTADSNGSTTTTVIGAAQNCTGQPNVTGNTNPVQNPDTTDVALEVDQDSDRDTDNDQSNAGQPDLVVVKQPDAVVNDNTILTLNPKHR